MSIEIVKNYFKSNNINKAILEFPVSSATVELAAQAAGVEPCLLYTSKWPAPTICTFYNFYRIIHYLHLLPLFRLFPLRYLNINSVL